MKYITSVWSTLLLVSALILLRVYDPALVEQVRLNTFDQYIKTLPEQKSNDIILVNIGEESLGKIGQFPWPRHEYAQMISDLRNINAGYIGFTIMFPEPDRFGGDDIFAQYMQDNGILLSQDVDANGRADSAPYVGYATFGTSDPLDFIYKYDGLVSNIKYLEQEAWGIGLINASPEVDNITRRIPLMSNVKDQLYPSFALEMTRLVQDQLSYTIKSNEAGIESVVIRPFEVPTDSDGSIWLKWNTEFEEIEYERLMPGYDNLEGKIVIVGVTAKGLANQIPTPGGLMYPNQLQAVALQTILQENPISRPLWADSIEILVSAVLALMLIVLVYRAPIWASGLGFVVLCVGQAGLTFYIWNKFYILLDLSYSLILYILSFASTSFNNFYKQFVLRQQIKKQFETYLDPRQVALLQKDPSRLKLGGERKEMTFLFMDIVGFTPISEHYKNNNDPEGLVEIINNYLNRMTNIILKNGGTIDKYMGDCIMAFWNAPLDCEDHAFLATKTAMEIERAADELIKELEDKGLPRIDVGIGINSGTCIVGNMGSETRFDYSVIGDAVNLAARLEGQTRNYDGVRVLLGEETYKSCPTGKFSEVDRIKVKGKSEQVRIYTPI
jgi:adenylate cyclase|tara:strand:- start:33 stop:1871 length:1839 start_codon:yes stop_codon:yes gene_type:complete